MADFMLEPSDIEPDRARPTRVTSAGLAPTADLPRQRRGPDTQPCYAPCEACGVPVLLGRTTEGTRLAVEPQRQTYVVLWEAGTAEPLLQSSCAYPVHVCAGYATL